MPREQHGNQPSQPSSSEPYQLPLWGQFPSPFLDREQQGQLQQQQDQLQLQLQLQQPQQQPQQYHQQLHQVQTTPPLATSPVKVKPDPEQPPQSAQESPPEGIDELTPEEASRIIHSHRKVRYGTACWPCRQRKVRCDNQMPCENCVKRDHPKLCSYKPKQSGPAAATAAALSSDVTLSFSGSRKRALSVTGIDQEEPSRAHRKNSWPRPLHHVDDLQHLEVARYMGQNSIPALLKEQTQDSSDQKKTESQDISQGMQSMFGMNTSAPFPLMSLHHIESLIRDMASSLPPNPEVMRLFKIYKETPQPFWGFIVDIDDFESRLVTYLAERSDGGGPDDKSAVRSPEPVSSSWLAILFGVLAVGSQFSDAQYSVRARDAQNYMEVAFHLQRASNFLLRPSFETMQAMLLTGFVLINDMKAEASWAMSALYCRLAISLGIHRPSKEDGRQSAPPDPKSTEMARRKIWWTCQWHDVLVSLSFDRGPITNIPCCPIPMRPESYTHGYSYLEAMHHIIQIIGQRLVPHSSTEFDYILETCDMLESVRQRCAPHLLNEPSDPAEDLNVNDRLQHYGLRLHTCFMVSVACRPALRRNCSYSAEQKQVLADRCRANHIETVRMFLKMHQLSVVPTRSWAYTYHGLSSALLLAILPETRSDPEFRQLQGELIVALTDAQIKDALTSQNNGDDELSGPLTRALAALKNMYDHGPILYKPARGSGMTSATGADGGVSSNGSRSPPPWALPVPGQQQPGQQLLGQQLPGQQLFAAASHMHALEQQQQQQRQQPDLDAHQDAAIAMAAMQNGGQMTGISSALPYSTSVDPPSLTLGDLGALDPMAYMSPMELFDQIFWPTSGTEYPSVNCNTTDFLEMPENCFFYR